MGADRPGAGPEVRLQPLTLKPPPDRLYGRIRSHTLRPRQRLLLDETVPRLRFDPAHAADPWSAFPQRPTRLSCEVGFGGGEHALAQIGESPQTALIACEVFETGICSLLSHVVPEGGEAAAPLPPNLRLWDDDARTLLRLLPDASLDTLFLMFPDPWPKMRHAKRRFVHPALLPTLARVLRPGAEWRIATDDPTYQQWVAEVMAVQPWFAIAAPVTARPAGWPPTRYEAKAEKAGRQPRYWSLTRAAR